MKAIPTPIKSPNPTRILRTVAQFSEEHDFVTHGGLRYQIFNAESNGLAESGALIRLGRKILIDEPKYFSWIDSQQKDVGDGVAPRSLNKNIQALNLKSHGGGSNAQKRQTRRPCREGTGPKTKE